MFKKPILIAEIGINHNGDINLAKKLIDSSADANFDAVKFQKRDINLVYSEELLNSKRESPWGTTQREQKEGLEFSEKEYLEIDSYCKKKKIKWFASAWDVNSLKFLDAFNLEYNKIASAMIVDLNLLKEVAKRKKHTFISTGMSTENDISKAVEIFRANKCSFELMHCVSTYPMKVEDANLLTINALKDKFKCEKIAEVPSAKQSYRCNKLSEEECKNSCSCNFNPETKKCEAYRKKCIWLDTKEGGSCNNKCNYYTNKVDCLTAHDKNYFNREEQ